MASSLVRSLLVFGLTAAACGGAQSPAELGAAAAADSRWSEAYSAYDRAVEGEPSSLELRRERVRAALRGGQLPELLSRLREEVGGEGGRPEPRFELALAVATAGEPGSDEEALELLDAVARGLPEAADVHYRIGLLRLEQERFDEAIAPLERALELDPRAPAYRVALAAALVETAEAARAREVLAELAELEPGEPDLERARAILDNLNSPLRRVPEALRETFSDTIEVLAEESGAPGEAVQLIEAALRQAPESEPFLVLNGLASVRLGQLARARTSFVRAAELAPEDPMPWLELAALDEQADRLRDAEDHLARAIAADPLSVDAWADLGRVRYQLRRYDEAAAAFRRLLVLDGGRMLSHLWLGRALRRLGDDEAAEAVYLAMLEQHPRNFEGCLQLGHIYRRRRVDETDRRRSEALLEQAVRWYRQALEIRPQDPMVQRLLEALEGDGGE